MFQKTLPDQAHFTVFRSAREETGGVLGSVASVRSAADVRIEVEATYFSRRAIEERKASIGGLSRKAREVHLELAMAYEFRAHLLTQQLDQSAASQLYAL